jgi:hypothetical protein
MTIDYSIPGKVKFTLLDYIKGVLHYLPDTPASSHFV